MDLMREYPDKHFDLAIVDPPYGIGDKLSIGGCKSPNRMQELYNSGNWNDVAPTAEYFIELSRVSKNQIIWGGNYFNLPPTRGFAIWDKVKFASNYSQCEYAWTSFDCIAKIYKFCSNGGFVVSALNKKIHPTQKPVELYDWLLRNYAKEGDTILDTHLGSGSHAIACHYAGLHLTACELDEDYYKSACERIKRETAQQTLF